MTQSGYLRLATPVALGMGITDGSILFCHVISEGSVDKKISRREYNNMVVYDRSNNPFTADCGRPDLNTPPITIDDRSHPHEYPIITLIRFQLPYLLPLKTLLLL